MADKRPGGRRAAQRPRKRLSAASLGRPAAVVLGAALTGLAWLYLVGAAIDFGVLAVQGQGSAWLFTVGAGIGAVVCLVLLLALVGRMLRMLGLMSDYRPRRAGTRRKA